MLSRLNLCWVGLALAMAVGCSGCGGSLASSTGPTRTIAKLAISNVEVARWFKRALVNSYTIRFWANETGCSSSSTVESVELRLLADGMVFATEIFTSPFSASTIGSCQSAQSQLLSTTDYPTSYPVATSVQIRLSYRDDYDNAGVATADSAVPGFRNLPAIVSFTVSPPLIAPGESTTLRWAVDNATSVTIAPSVGEVPATGSATVSPAATQEYVLTATNSDGSVSASVCPQVAASGASGRAGGPIGR